MIDVKKLDDVQVDGIDHRDYPDFCDAFLVYATYEGRELTEKELDEVQEENPEWFYEQVEKAIY
jgi:hypothetical protein